MAISRMRTRCYMGIPNALTLSVTNLESMYADIRTLNIPFVRITLPWTTIQPSSARYVWAQADEAINAALAAGLQPMVVLAPPAPEWAGKLSSCANLFGAMAGVLATRYRPNGSGIRSANAGKGVVEYQIWDEPNAVENWPSSVNAIEYTLFLKAAHDAIAAVQPSAKIVFAGLQACIDQRTKPRRSNVTTVNNREPAGFVADAYAAGAKDYFDIMAYHPASMATRQNPKPDPPSLKSIEPSDKIYKVMSANGDSAKKTYWTAVGYDTTSFTEIQQRDYTETLKWLAHERAQVTGFGLYCYRDF